MSRRRLRAAMNLDRALLRAAHQQERDETDSTAPGVAEVKNTRDTSPQCDDRIMDWSGTAGSADVIAG